MNKKKLIQLADYIRTWNNGHQGDFFSEGQIDHLAHFCAQNNPRFDKERWLGYISGECGPNGGKKING